MEDEGKQELRKVQEKYENGVEKIIHSLAVNNFIVDYSQQKSYLMKKITSYTDSEFQFK